MEIEKPAAGGWGGCAEGVWPKPAPYPPCYLLEVGIFVLVPASDGKDVWKS
jgi:hypothetical protein